MIDKETLKKHQTMIAEAVKDFQKAKDSLAQSNELKEYNKCQQTLASYQGAFNAWLKGQLGVDESQNEILIADMLLKVLDDNPQ